MSGKAIMTARRPGRGRFAALIFLTGCAVPLAVGQDSPLDEDVAARSGRTLSAEPRPGTVVVSDADPAGWGNDDYALNGGRISGDSLILGVSYSGGCAPHAFTLVVPASLGDPPPEQLVVSLSHEANGDRCEAWLTSEYSFDLAIIRNLYLETFGETFGQSRGEVELALGDLPPGSLVYALP